jgi:hypothetical protein
MGHQQPIKGAYAPSLSDALRPLQDLRAELGAKLLRNAQYRALLAIERAIQEIISGSADQETVAPPEKISQSEAAAQALGECARPLPLDDLVRTLRAKGVKFRAKHPEMSLSANLSNHKQFRSVQYQGKRCWWFSNRPVPSDSRYSRSRDLPKSTMSVH